MLRAWRHAIDDYSVVWRTFRRLLLVLWIFGWPPLLWIVAGQTGWTWPWIVSLVTFAPWVAWWVHIWRLDRGAYLSLGTLSEYPDIEMTLVSTRGVTENPHLWANTLAQATPGFIVFRDPDTITPHTVYHELRHQQHFAWFGPLAFPLYWAFTSLFEADADRAGDRAVARLLTHDVTTYI